MNCDYVFLCIYYILLLILFVRIACKNCQILCIYVTSEATTSYLRGCKCQNFPGGACPQTPLVLACLRTPLPPLYKNILARTLSSHQHHFLLSCCWSYKVCAGLVFLSLLTPVPKDQRWQLKRHRPGCERLS